jgi:hypothetical protein
MSNEKFSFYKEYPKGCAEEDFWGQVKRTVNGVPVAQEQIDLIVSAVVSGLCLSKKDVLLDLCCGNGALSNLFFEHCSSGLGVDFSEYLISIANKFFTARADFNYILSDVVAFCSNPITPDLFTKAVCYGSFSYLEKDKSEALLVCLAKNFKNLERVFIGNCPDKSCISQFFGSQSRAPEIEDEPDSAVGIWRTKDEFVSMADKCGWKVMFTKMPDLFYAAHYRFDVILYR